jgi:predicted GNAT family N-acyltransferase
MRVKITYKKISDLSEFVDSIRIRVDVFIIEQQCKPGWEPDEDDKEAIHYAAIIDSEIVATARVREVNNKEYTIERMAMKKAFRNKGIGKGFMDYIIREIKKNKPRKVWIRAQVHAQQFYEKCGFRAVSEKYDLYNLNIPHVDMVYDGK